MTIEVVIPEIRIERSAAENDYLTVPGFGRTTDEGWPSLPVGYFTVQLPRGTRVTAVTVIDAESQVRGDLRLAGGEGAGPFDYPGLAVEGETLHGERGDSILGLAIYPVNWWRDDAGREQVELLTRLRVWVSIE